jgi:C-1 hydroxylase
MSSPPPPPPPQPALPNPEPPSLPNPEPAEVTANNKDIMRRLNIAFSQGDTTAIDQYFSPNIVSHSPHVVPFDGHPLQSMKEEMQLPFRAFSQQNFREESLVAEGDMVFLGWEVTGTFRGPVHGAAGTGAPFQLTGGDVVRFKDGLVIEHWDHFTKPRLESLIQFGVLDQQMLNNLNERGLL